MFEEYNAPVKFVTAAKFADREQSKKAYEALEALAKRNRGKEYHILIRHFLMSGIGVYVAFLTLANEPDEALQDEIAHIFAKRGGEPATLSDEFVKSLCVPMDFAPGHEKEGTFTWTMSEEQDTAPFCRSTRRLRHVQIEEKNKYASMFNVTKQYPSNALPKWFVPLQSIVEDDTFTSMVIWLGTDVELHVTLVEDAK